MPKNARRNRHPAQEGGLVFRYTGPQYRVYPLVQLVAFLVFAIGVIVYYQFISPWHGGFIRVPSARTPVAIFLVIFLVVTCFKPILDFLSYKNEKIEVSGTRLVRFDRLGRKSFEDQIRNIKLFRAGVPITTRLTGSSKRYIYTANGKYFNFSGDIDDAPRLLQLLGEE
jgi:hypothetical protein